MQNEIDKNTKQTNEVSRDVWTNRLYAFARVLAGIALLGSIALEFYLKTN